MDLGADHSWDIGYLDTVRVQSPWRAACHRRSADGASMAEAPVSQSIVMEQRDYDAIDEFFANKGELSVVIDKLNDAFTRIRELEVSVERLQRGEDELSIELGEVERVQYYQDE
jgi:hypothetical protein